MNIGFSSAGAERMSRVHRIAECTPSRLRAEKDSSHLATMLWFMTAFSIVVLAAWLFRFRPVSENPVALMGTFVVGCLGCSCWSLIAYQAASGLDLVTLNRRVSLGASVVLAACIATVPTFQFLLFQAKGYAAPWVAVSKGYANEFSYVILVISGISFRTRIVTTLYLFIIAGQVFLAYKASTSAAYFVFNPYANQMTEGFDIGGSVTNMIIATGLYLGLLKTISLHREILSRIKYVAPPAA